MDIFLCTLFVVTCLLLIIVVLLQKGRGGGLGAAFGGAGSSAFGTRTGDVFTWVTIVLTGLFLLLAVGTSMYFRPPAGSVEMPVFKPTEGPIDGATPVTITCITPKARISYTTDGSRPSMEKALRARSVTATVYPGQTLKAQAFRKDWKTSPLVAQTYDKAIEATRPASGPAAEAPTPPASAPAGAS